MVSLLAVEGGGWKVYNDKIHANLCLSCYLLDRVSVLQKEDWRGVIDLFTNAKQVVSSVQDVAWKLADYTKLPGNAKYSGMGETSN